MYLWDKPFRTVQAFRWKLYQVNLTGTLRAFDSAFVMQQISNQMVIDGVSDSFMSAEDINEWLSIYRDNVGDDDLTTDELLLEFNLFMPYVALGFTQFTKNDSLGTKDIHPFQKKL